MLQFKIDWEDEPRVRDPLLGASWARLEIRAGDAAREFCLTDCVGERSHSLRQGVYGSVFPVAEWIVANWWSLLNESLRADRFRGARLLANDAALRSWVQRHSLLAARGGFALPDLTLYHDGGRIAVRCVPDPFDVESPYPVRFVRNIELRLPSADAAAGLQTFVEAVVDRVRERAPREPGTQELLSNWEAVRDSSRTEAGICAAAAAMGLDPYDSGELTDELVDVLEGPFSSLVPSLQWDLAESTTREAVPIDLNWVLTAAALSGPQVAEGSSGLPGESGATSAHQAGYERARWFIDRIGLPPVDDLEGFVRARCGWSASAEPPPHTDGVATRISALVGPDASGRPRLIPSAASRQPESSRFLLGRALFFAPSGDFHAPQRLLTRASAWPQRASRAFAAELLAPADELRRRVAGQVTYEQVADLAREFQVSPMVIEHQLENHGIARIIDL
jgi:hypothetical protein